MTRLDNLRKALLCFGLLLFCAPMVWGARQTANGLSTPEQFKDDFQNVLCKDKERLGAVKILFEKMGAEASDITVEKKRGVENVVIRKPGTAEGIIVVGAHYDKAGDGCGAVDNWTGIVAIAHVYRSLKKMSLNKTVLFMAFGAEEMGLVGSRGMASAINKEEVSRYCAMINIDSLGLSVPQAADNMSTPKLLGLAEELAKEMKMPFGHSAIDGANSDSSAFIERKIPAITIHGMTDDWRKILHSINDQASKVNPTSVYLGYRLVLALVSRLDTVACDAYRR